MSGPIKSDSAEYAWSPQGMSYPGVPNPFIPAAASVLWDWSALAFSNRPDIGGPAAIRTINSGGWGAINTGEGRSYIDLFSGPQEKPLRGSWISEGSPHAYKDGKGRVKWAGGQYRSRSGTPSDFYVNSNALGSSDQDVTAQIDRWSIALGVGYAASGTIICSYDPVTGDGIFFRHRDNSSQTTASAIYVRKNGATRTIWSTTYSPNYGAYEHRLVREGNTVRGYLNGTLVATVTDNNLPTGEHFGFALEAGQMKEIRGKALVPGSDARGILLPTSVNVNNRRGITVSNSGSITIDTPGYYMVSLRLNAARNGTYNGFGGEWTYEYWLSILHGGVRYEIGNNASRYDGAGFNHIQGSFVSHMSGPIQLAIHTNAPKNNRVSRIDTARLDIARVA